MIFIMVSDVLKRLRAENNLTQKQIAEILKIDRSTYAYYETGRTIPDIYTLIVISRIYNISPEDILNLCYGETFSSSNSSTKIEMRSEYNNNDFNGVPLYLSELSREEQLLVLYFRQIKEKQKSLDYIKEVCFKDLDDDCGLFCGEAVDDDFKISGGEET